MIMAAHFIIATHNRYTVNIIRQLTQTASYNKGVTNFVGIGNNNPQNPLDVTGNVSISGSMTIGTVSSAPSGYHLYVQDGILTEKVKVAVSGSSDWSDYIFDKDYKLQTLSEIAKYTKSNKHLPSVPSVEDVMKNGIDLGKMDAILLGKIEELYLYVIDQQKQIEALNAKLTQK
jgi:hypothetical protein